MGALKEKMLEEEEINDWLDEDEFHEWLEESIDLEDRLEMLLNECDGDEKC